MLQTLPDNNASALSRMQGSIGRFRIRRLSTNEQDSQRPPNPSDQEIGVEGGPVAGKRSVPACDRCRTFKKKCSRTFPVCSLCARAGQRCSLSECRTSNGEEVRRLKARVDWLSRFIIEGSSDPVESLENIQTGADLQEVLQQSPGFVSAPSQTPGANTGELEIDIQSTSEKGGNIYNINRFADVPAAGSVPSSSWLPPDAVARRFVDAYFRHVNRAYPFIDRKKVLEDLETFGDLAQQHRKEESTTLYLIMAIGCTTLQRAGQIPKNTSSRFDVAYEGIIQECLGRESMSSIQILVLLALYSLFDPAGPSTFSVVGLVSRQATLLGLTRRETDSSKATSVEAEQRHRMFWSIYVLDRMIATSLGQPVALIDSNMDVPLPGLTVDEFASPNRPQAASVLQTTRHVVQLRQIECQILEKIHLRPTAELSFLSQSDRRAITQSLITDIENWYSHGCLLSPLETDNVPLHNSVAWFSARYYYLLLLVHYPSHFNAFGRRSPQKVLLGHAQRHVQSNSILLQQGQLPLNKVTLCRMFPVGVALMHCAAFDDSECRTSSIRDPLSALQNIFQAFSESWISAHKASQILSHLIVSLDTSSNYHPLHITQSDSMSDFNRRDLMNSHLTEFLSLLREVLGITSCYGSSEILVEEPTFPRGNDSEGIRSSYGMPPSDINYAGTTVDLEWTNNLDLDFV